MSLLAGVITKKSPSAPKGIVYGPPGIGKSTYGASIPNSLIIDCENGLGAIKSQRTPYLSKWLDIQKWLVAVETEDHGHKAIVIDSIDWLLRRIEEHVSGCEGDTSSTLNRSHGGYGNGKQVLLNYVYQILLPQFDRIVSKGIPVILLAHAKRTAIMDIDGVEIEKTSPDIPDDYLNKIIEWSDFVFLARKDNEGGRVMLTSETSRALAKNRYNLPEIIPFEWQAFTASMKQGLAKTFN